MSRRVIYQRLNCMLLCLVNCFLWCGSSKYVVETSRSSFIHFHFYQTLFCSEVWFFALVLILFFFFFAFSTKLKTEWNCSTLVIVTGASNIMWPVSDCKVESFVNFSFFTMHWNHFDLIFQHFYTRFFSANFFCIKGNSWLLTH